MIEVGLKDLRTSKNIPAKEMVEVVRAIYPKYDKTVQSKCENGKLYGVELKRDAMNALIDKFAPEYKRIRKSDGHKLKRRIGCRLEDLEYETLIKNIRADGYSTVQDWLTAVVRKYNKRKERKNESSNSNNGQ